MIQQTIHSVTGLVDRVSDARKHGQSNKRIRHVATLGNGPGERQSADPQVEVKRTRYPQATQEYAEQRPEAPTMTDKSRERLSMTAGLAARPSSRGLLTRWPAAGLLPTCLRARLLVEWSRAAGSDRDTGEISTKEGA